MESYHGVARVRVEPWSEANVIIDFIDGHVIVWEESEGRWLGSWPAVDVRAEPLSPGRLLIILGKEEVPLNIEDQKGFVSAIETATRTFLDMDRPQRLKSAARIRMLALRRRDSISRGDLVATNPRGRGAARSDADAIETKDKDFAKLAGPRAIALEPTARGAVRSRVARTQRDVVEAIQSAMESWFAFYFAMGEGSGIQRLETATTGLSKASERLTDIHENLTEMEDKDQGTVTQLDSYRLAVERWAEAMSLLRRGLELNQRHVAEKGLGRMGEASAIAERLVMAEQGSGQPSPVKEALARLSKLQAPDGVTRKAVANAKEPWERSIVAAGAPINWD